MNTVEKSVLVAHSAEKMFTLVDHIESYPDFLPWCGRSEVSERTDAITVGTIHIDYRGIKQSFTTANNKQFPARMDLTLKDGPFKHLAGHWQFIELSADACKIEFNLEYVFANQLLEKLIAPVFNYIATTFVDSFVKEADKRFIANKELT